MMRSGNVKMALEAIRSARWRSLLTMLGIIIGVVSVVTTVSLGEGAKQRIVGQIDQAGRDLITIRPGRALKRGDNNHVAGLGQLGTLSTGSFSEADFRTIESTPGISHVVPFAYVNGLPGTRERDYPNGVIIATNEGLPNVLRQKLQYGGFFEKDATRKEVAVIGRRVAEQLFQENVPIGKLFHVRDRQFVVVGIFEEFETSPLTPNIDYNTAIFIPMDAAKEVNDGQLQLYQILTRPSAGKTPDQAVQAITASLSHAHSGQIDFAVLKAEDTLAIATEVLNLLTSFIAGIAAISLVVAGIGILNIMFVSVTERTHEIGIRKAVGATNQQILGQFLTEAIILSLTGGLLGLVGALLTNYLFRIFTDLTPVLTWPIMLAAVGGAVVVGIVFGVTPALKAARKHPIDALRDE